MNIYEFSQCYETRIVAATNEEQAWRLLMADRMPCEVDWHDWEPGACTVEQIFANGMDPQVLFRC